LSAPPNHAPDPSWWRGGPRQPRPGLAELVLGVATTSVTEHDAEALLRGVCGQLTQLCGLAGCAAVVFDGSTGAVRILVASHPEAEQLTRLVQQLGLGIGSAAIRAGRDTALEDLTQSVRAGLAEAAARVGLPVTAVVALRGADELVGCLQLFGRTMDTLASGLLSELAPLADVLGAALGNIEAYRHSASLVASLTTALDRQGPIEQAKGMLAERHGVDLDAAYRMLREQAHRQATTVVAVAAELVNQSWRATGPMTEHTPVGEPRPRLEVPEQNGGELTAELSPSAATEAPLPEQRGGSAEVESHPAT
jgi:transcriptional regulator with GAF, ATPase, and Fis domain